MRARLPSSPKTGPFGWRGLLARWCRLTIFGISVAVTCFVLLISLKKQLPIPTLSPSSPPRRVTLCPAFSGVTRVTPFSTRRARAALRTTSRMRMMLCAIALGGTYLSFVEAIRGGRRDRAFAFPVFCTLFWFAHDTVSVIALSPQHQGVGWRRWALTGSWRGSCSSLC
jgi:hypothetical protein